MSHPREGGGLETLKKRGQAMRPACPFFALALLKKPIFKSEKRDECKKEDVGNTKHSEGQVC